MKYALNAWTNSVTDRAAKTFSTTKKCEKIF